MLASTLFFSLTAQRQRLFIRLSDIGWLWPRVQNISQRATSTQDTLRAGQDPGRTCTLNGNMYRYIQLTDIAIASNTPPQGIHSLAPLVLVGDTEPNQQGPCTVPRWLIGAASLHLMEAGLGLFGGFFYLSDDDGEDVSSQLVPQKDSITHLHPASLPTPPTTTPLPSLPSELRPSPGPSASDRRRRGGCRL